MRLIRFFRKLFCSDSRWFAGVTIVGLSATVTQVILIRELISLFHGNELTIGMVLSGWMILTAVGSLAGYREKRRPATEQTLLNALMILNILPFLTLAWMTILRLKWAPFGVMLGADDVFVLTLLTLFPFCFFSGYLFVLFAVFIRNQMQKQVTNLVYSYESIGSVVGGLIFNTALIYFLTATQILMILFLVNTLVILMLGKKLVSRRWRIAVIVWLCLISGIYLSKDWDHIRRQVLLPGHTILYNKETPYGILTITEQEGQKNYFENHQWMSSTGDIQGIEEMAHFAMLQHRDPKRILVVSGGLLALTDELLKYNPEVVDYASINPWWLKDSAMTSAIFTDPRIRLIDDEPRQYIRNHHIRHHKGVYDVIILDIPDPTTAALNRFFTIEFLKELRSITNDRTVVMYGLSSSADYLSDEKRRSHSTIVGTLSSGFKNYLILPGVRDYVLLSDEPLTSRIAEQMSSRELKTQYVNSYYIQDDWLKRRSDWIHAALETPTEINYDFRPIAYLELIRLWLSSVGYSSWALIVTLVILSGIFIRFGNPYAWSMMIVGMTGASAEILLLLAFQILFANVYYLIGLLIAVFMAGMALGSRLLPDAWWSRRRYIVLQGSLALLILISAGVIGTLPQFMYLEIIIYLISGMLFFIIAGIAGMLFHGASVLNAGTVRQTAARLYGLDMIGAGLGTLSVTIFFFPVWGLEMTSLMLVAMNVLALFVLLIFKQRKINGS